MDAPGGRRQFLFITLAEVMDGISHSNWELVQAGVAMSDPGHSISIVLQPQGTGEQSASVWGFRAPCGLHVVGAQDHILVECIFPIVKNSGFSF